MAAFTVNGQRVTPAKNQKHLCSPVGHNSQLPLAAAQRTVHQRGECGANPLAGVRQIPVPDLREMDFGIFEGLNYMDLADSAAYREWVEGNCLGPVPQGESKELFCQRVCAAFASLVDRSLRGGERPAPSAGGALYTPFPAQLPRIPGLPRH